MRGSRVGRCPPQPGSSAGAGVPETDGEDSWPSCADDEAGDSSCGTRAVAGVQADEAGAGRSAAEPLPLPGPPSLWPEFRPTRPAQGAAQQSSRPAWDPAAPEATGEAAGDVVAAASPSASRTGTGAGSRLARSIRKKQQQRQRRDTQH